MTTKNFRNMEFEKVDFGHIERWELKEFKEKILSIFVKNNIDEIDFDYSHYSNSCSVEFTNKDLDINDLVNIKKELLKLNHYINDKLNKIKHLYVLKDVKLNASDYRKFSISFGIDFYLNC